MKKILFVCRANLIRSRAAQEVFENDKEFEVKSAGTHAYSNRGNTQLSNELEEWADIIIVLDQSVASYIKHQEKVKVIHISPDFKYNNPQLKEIIKNKVLPKIK